MKVFSSKCSLPTNPRKVSHSKISCYTPIIVNNGHYDGTRICCAYVIRQQLGTIRDYGTILITPEPYNPYLSCLYLRRYAPTLLISTIRWCTVNCKLNNEASFVYYTERERESGTSKFMTNYTSFLQIINQPYYHIFRGLVGREHFEEKTFI